MRLTLANPGSSFRLLHYQKSGTIVKNHCKPATI